MYAEEIRTLWCFVDGDPNPIDIPAVLSVTISHLMKEIKQQKSNFLRDFDASSLVLWQLNEPEPAEPQATLAQRIASRGSDMATFATELTVTQKVLTLFPQHPPEDHVHILVKLPSTTSRKHPYSSPAEDDDHKAKRKRTAPYQAIIEDQKLPSEHSLHKLWELARESQPTLFETRPVQRDNSSETKLPSNCMMLNGGDWVQELEPDFRFTGALIRDEYMEALRAIMKWFLHATVTKDAVEVEDTMEEDTVEVEDVSPAHLENPFLTIPTGHVSPAMGFVLVGSPGIGKTAFLYVLLVLRLQARLPTIYQSRDSHLYYFDDSGVFLIDLTRGVIAADFKSQFHRSTWCLIDSNQSVNTVPMFIQDLDLFIVQASSPRSHRFEWMKKANKPVTQYFMKSWSLSELLVGRVLQHKVSSEAQIEFFSNHYGTSARSVYTHASNPSYYHATLTSQMASLTYEALDSLVRRTAGLDMSGPVPHLIVLISPDTSRNFFKMSFQTRYIYEKLRDQLSNQRLEAVARLYKMYVRFPSTRGNTRFMLEDAVNDVFPRGGEWSLVAMEKSSQTGPKCTHWHDPEGPTSRQYLHLGYMGRHIAIDTDPNPVGTEYTALPLVKFITGAQIQLKDGYYCPSSRSEATFDGFIYESASKTATVFQVAASEKHSVKEKGLKWLRNLGVKKFRYVAVSTPDTPLDLPFPNKWDVLIPEKYLLTVESLPTS